METRVRAHPLHQRHHRPRQSALEKAMGWRGIPSRDSRLPGSSDGFVCYQTGEFLRPYDYVPRASASSANTPDAVNEMPTPPWEVARRPVTLTDTFQIRWTRHPSPFVLQGVRMALRAATDDESQAMTFNGAVPLG